MNFSNHPTTRVLNNRTFATVNTRILEKSYDVYVFSVNPQAIKMEQGSMGAWTIKACEPGKDVSEPLSVKDIIVSYYDDGMGRMTPSYQDGIRFAEELVNGGPQGVSGCEPHTKNNMWRGVFLWKEALPDFESQDEQEMARCARFVQEVQAAKGRYGQYLDSLIAQADSLYAEGPNSYKYIGPVHREACAIRKQKRNWFMKPVDQAECPNCMAAIDPRAKKCLTCGEWVDGRGEAQASAEPRARHRDKGAQA